MAEQPDRLMRGLTVIFLILVILFGFVAIDLTVSTVVVLNHNTKTIIRQFEWELNPQSDRVFFSIDIDTPKAGILPKALFLEINMTVESIPNFIIQNKTVKFGQDPTITLSKELTLSQTYRLIRGDTILLYFEIDIIPIIAGIKISSATRTFQFRETIYAT